MRNSSTHMARRGRRKPPVKNVARICRMIDAGNSRPDQWCAWRSSRPPGTSKVRRIVESNALETSAPWSRA
jgi:hypothetical protein